MNIVVKKILWLIFSTVSYILPKNKKLWVFYPTHFKNKYAGNIKALYEYCIDEKLPYKIVIINLPETHNINKAQLDGNIVSGIKNFKAIWLLLRANLVFVDSSFFIQGRFNVIQLWHDNGFKKVQALNPRNDYKIIKKASNNIKLLIASSESDKKRKQECFLTNNVYITGSPGNDVFFKDIQFENKSKFKKYRKIFLYAPTFRDDGVFKPFNYEDLCFLNKYMESNEYIFLVKFHPGDKNIDQSIYESHSNILNITNIDLDVQDILKITNVLISDYSGIFIDFSLLKRPIIFYSYDIDKYLKVNRGLYYNYHSIVPGPFVMNFNELYQTIQELSWFDENEYVRKYNKFLSIFNDFFDSNSSSRVIDKIIELKL